LFLGWLVLNYASGLAVYFVTSNLLGIIQYGMMGRVNWRNLLPGGSKPAPSNVKKNK
jgi:YidC/Oxa1 family membrane protein insertase